MANKSARKRRALWVAGEPSGFLRAQGEYRVDHLGPPGLETIAAAPCTDKRTSRAPGQHR